jgi:hypothetical protein
VGVVKGVWPVLSLKVGVVKGVLSLKVGVVKGVWPVLSLKVGVVKGCVASA